MDGLEGEDEGISFDKTGQHGNGGGGGSGGVHRRISTSDDGNINVKGILNGILRYFLCKAGQLHLGAVPQTTTSVRTTGTTEDASGGSQESAQQQTPSDGNGDDGGGGPVWEWCEGSGVKRAV